MSRRSTESLLSLLDAAAPGFRAWSLSGDNLFDLDSLHGVFAACSHFVRAVPRGSDVWPVLAELVNEAVAGQDAQLAEAVCTCLLENLASPDHPLGSLLRGGALVYWRQWSSAP